MGTNYYVRTPACETACEHCSEAHEVHLGKSSWGWKFGFQAQPEWPRDQALTLWKALAQSGQIFSEYREPVGFDELWEMIQDKQDSPNCHLDPTGPAWRPPVDRWTLDSIRSHDWHCDGYDFCDRYFS
jgi:organic radical activating enzyme